MSWNDPVSPCIAILFICSMRSLIKKLRFHDVVKRSLIFHFLIFVLNLHTAIRFTGCCKVKIIAVKVCIHHLHFSRFICNSLAKVMYFQETNK